MIEYIKQPWPWYIAGPLIGLVAPALLLLGNKTFGISASFRHICAACLPANISFFKYNWKKESWNLFFVTGIIIGGSLATYLLSNLDPVAINPKTIRLLQAQGINDFTRLLPQNIFGFHKLFTLRGMTFSVLGGFLVGFGARYAGGCTSGHTIMGISSLQWPSLVASCCFMVGGFFLTWFILPYLLLL